jgi:integrase
MYNSINDKLEKMESFIDNYFNSSALRSTQTSLIDLKERFKKKFTASAEEQSDEFFFLFTKFREETASTKGWTKNRAETMERLENKVREFKSDIKFSDLTTATMDAFKVHLSKSMYNDALAKHLSYFKQFITWAQKKKYEIHEEFFTYNPVLPQAKKAIRYLELSELDAIYKLDLSGKDGLERARDIFIFQCYTALRESDVRRLKRENIYLNADGQYVIDILTEKDDDRIHFRLPQRAVEVYLKYKDYVYENDLALPIISQQKYNEHLKEIGKAADLQGYWIDYQYRLNEKIVIKTPKDQLSSHTARRTFIVTAMNEGVTLDVIALITSHSDVSAMKPYIKANTRGTDAVIKAIDKTIEKKTKKKGSKKTTKK